MSVIPRLICGCPRHANIADAFYVTAAVAAITGMLLHVFWDPNSGAASTKAPAEGGSELHLGPGGLRVVF